MQFHSINKIFFWLQALIIVACFVSGILAGGNVYRYIIEVPAWKHLNIVSWVEYSRNADLKNGLFLFPIEAILSSLLFVFASVIILRNRKMFRSIVMPLHLATLFALTGLGFTFFAAPYVLSLRTMGNDPELLQQTFDHFHFWGLLRAIAQVLSFLACVIGLGKMVKLKSL